MQDAVFEIKGEINNATASVVIKQILEFSNRNPEGVITLYISSEGGDVTAGLAIYDVVRYVSNPVSTIAEGKVSGIATLILVAGTPGMRFIYNDTCISLGLFLIKKDAESISPEINAIVRNVYGIIAKHTKMWVEQIVEMADSGIEMDAEMAVKNRVVDKVIQRKN